MTAPGSVQGGCGNKWHFCCQLANSCFHQTNQTADSQTERSNPAVIDSNGLTRSYELHIISASVADCEVENGEQRVTSSNAPKEAKKGGPAVVGAKKRRRPRQVVPDDMKDDKYWELRRKNTEAARKSRQSKKIMSDRSSEFDALEESCSLLLEEVKKGQKALEDFKGFLGKVVES